MNHFHKHGIRHLSASSLNLYRTEPALWLLKYVYKVKDKSAMPKAWRGLAVEAGLDSFLYERAPVIAEQRANNLYGLHSTEFANANDGIFAQDADKVGELIPKMLTQAIDATKSWPLPLAHQIKIAHTFDGVDVPVIGYIDYRWSDSLVDLKTTERLPSKPRPDHARQVSLYAAATKCKPKLLYVTHQKSALYDVEPEPHLADLARAARTIQHFLTVCEDKAAMSKLLIPRYDDFHWSDSLETEARRIWK
jgi:hypothetical protein